jgi:hypothetical protein
LPVQGIFRIQEENHMLNHIALIKFKPSVDETEIQMVEDLLDDLPNKIVEIHQYEFGRDIIQSERSYDFALVALFANPESLQRYQEHPDHLAVVKKLKSMSENIVTVDFLGSDAGTLKDRIPDQGLPEW